MSELITASADPQDVVDDLEHVVEAVSQPQVIITEQEIAFSTAASVPLPRTETHTQGDCRLARDVPGFTAECTAGPAPLSAEARQLSRAGRHVTRNAKRNALPVTPLPTTANRVSIGG